MAKHTCLCSWIWFTRKLNLNKIVNLKITLNWSISNITHTESWLIEFTSELPVLLCISHVYPPISNNAPLYVIHISYPKLPYVHINGSSDFPALHQQSLTFLVTLPFSPTIKLIPTDGTLVASKQKKNTLFCPERVQKSLIWFAFLAVPFEKKKNPKQVL